MTEDLMDSLSMLRLELRPELYLCKPPSRGNVHTKQVSRGIRTSVNMSCQVSMIKFSSSIFAECCHPVADFFAANLKLELQA